MTYYIASFFISYTATLILIRYQHKHNNFTGDFQKTGPQKIHYGIVPRIGGVSIAIGFLLPSIAEYLAARETELIAILICVCSIPTFSVALTEDLTKKISVKLRLLGTSISAAILILSFGASIHYIGIMPIDIALSYPIISFAFTCFSVVGLTNAYNIIDGLNGLSSLVAVITLIAISYVCFQTGDMILFNIAMTLIASILGFFLWNYPRGLIFLGDSGAYLIGFMTAAISILLVQRNIGLVSPWFALLVNAYPIVETVFSIYRRKFHHKRSAGQSDAMHLHSLIFRRLLISHKSKNIIDKKKCNSMTSPYLWVLCSSCSIPAAFLYQSSLLLALIFLVFCYLYLWVYSRILLFRIPTILKKIAV
jgi:UDP-N-acetylmuramyl pentapeptide phosphotransferase/UDP-N-acetylglucosamine-1-phosphate transferase